MGRPDATPIGVILAGGAGRRLGGAKATVELHGRPLISFPLGALRAVLPQVVVQAKAASSLPDLGETPLWIEPARPSHPLFGIIHALQRAAPRPVLVCAADLPFVGAPLLARIAVARGAAVTVARGEDERLHPLLGLYRAEALEPLRDALSRDPRISLTAAVGKLDHLTVAADRRQLLNVNTPEDLRRAASLPAQPKVKS